MSHGVYRGAAMDVARGNIHRGFTLASSGGIPPGVTLQDIDGGSTYYGDNGFTYAVTAGWDDPSFVPVAVFLQPLENQTDADSVLDKGINTLLGANSTVAVANSPNLAVMRTNNLSFVAQASELDRILTNNGGSLGSESVGINAYDEPTTYAQAIGALGSVANTHQDDRFWYENYFHNQLSFGDVEGHEMHDILDDLIATPNATTRHLDIAGVDIYWFAGDPDDGEGAYSATTLYDVADTTSDQRRRGARYGDMIDWIRLGNPIHGHDPWQETYPAPTGVWVETGSPYENNTLPAHRIQPAELPAAVWNTIIHGARIIKYFFHSFGPGGEDAAMPATLLATNDLVQQLATVINSPFALGYLTAVSPAGWNFGASGPADGLNLTGMDTMVKYHNVSGGDDLFYIFAHPRYSAATTGQSVTFTIADTSATVATVINESRTVSISGGVFSDTFATGNTVHIYRIEN